MITADLSALKKLFRPITDALTYLGDTAIGVYPDFVILVVMTELSFCGEAVPGVPALMEITPRSNDCVTVTCFSKSVSVLFDASYKYTF